MIFRLMLTCCLVLAGCNLIEKMPVAREHREPRESRRNPNPLPPRDERDEAVSLGNLRKSHPRLLVTQDDFDRIRKAIDGNDELLARWQRKLKQRGEQLLDDPLPRYQPTLLTVSRTTFTHIVTLAGMYRLTGDSHFADRARDEMLAVARFRDWNPSDFLSTGEMTAAVAIGYDWLFDRLSREDRAIIRAAIIEKGLTPGIKGYRNGADWSEASGNWNFVCNGGLVLGALAVADEEPKFAAQILARAPRSMSRAFKSFAPDGGWDEGASYWNYATRYATYALAAMDTALGDDQNLGDSPGFSRTGLFRIYVQGPSRKLFNFGDCGEGTSASPQLFWMARRFKQPVYAAFEIEEQKNDPTMLDLLWHQPASPDAIAKLPLAMTFRGVDVTSIRSAWNEPGATYVAFKGGSNEARHGHLDVGTFVLDALGERWAIDLGAENYNLRGYMGEKRGNFYRASTAGHNTITIDGENQEEEGQGAIVASSEQSPAKFGVADLSRAYRHKPRIMRGIMLVDGSKVLVQDEIHAGDGRHIIWNFHTRASIDIDPSGAAVMLTHNGKHLRMEILSPGEARFERASANPPPPQTQQPDVHKLVIRLPVTKQATTIAVLFTPMDPNAGAAMSRSLRTAPRIEPLSKWIEDARGDRAPRR